MWSRPSAFTQLAFWLTLFGPLAMAAASQRPAAAPPVIIDTDAGSDDLMAIAFLLARPDVRIEAITVCNGLAHVEPGAANIRRLVALGGQPDIPVFAGRPTALRTTAEFPDEWRKVSDELPGVDLPRASRKGESRGASEYLADRLADASKPVRVLALGPLTNIAEALQRRPAIARAISEIVMMGGAVRVPGNLRDGDFFKTDNHTAEWNLFVDPDAAHIVFTAGIPIRLVPLDATNRVPITVAFLDDFRARAATPLGRLVAQVLDTVRPYVESHHYFAWDPLAAVALVDGSVLKTARRAIAIDRAPPHEGRTRLVEGAAPSVTVGEDADAAAFTRIFLSPFTKR